MREREGDGAEKGEVGRKEGREEGRGGGRNHINIEDKGNILFFNKMTDSRPSLVKAMVFPVVMYGCES